MSNPLRPRRPVATPDLGKVKIRVGRNAKINHDPAIKRPNFRGYSRIQLEPIHQEFKPLEEKNDIEIKQHQLLRHGDSTDVYNDNNNNHGYSDEKHKNDVHEDENQNEIPADNSLVQRNNDIPTIVEQFWSQLRQHIASQTTKNDNWNHGLQKTNNKVVRVFVSSTFTDFFNEREVLIKKVFPALRENLEPCGIQLIDCDLRWGVPKDSTTEQTILACLEEIDRCFEDNGQPFFIGLISEKYGWVPDKEELPKSISKRYDWIHGASITLMEFIHGAFRTNNPNACYLVRNSNALTNVPEKYKAKFFEKDAYGQHQVQELKNQLKDLYPNQVFDYDGTYSGLETTEGRERVKISGLQEFEKRVFTFLTKAIEDWYPSSFEKERSTDVQITGKF
ncbi:unnamed protein product [Didymodactylos carnosus]|uniref:DUF4062 domain-containing protein n=1 Tax=Didymodactylos carnosus TaxID=1234261 RepID=A0A813YNW2_9BILA|nr:unnamed protein product [Didymodactylos carnosus]CAF1139502.1 unnamed protein product [Didymodactylos carnosus]CAF3671964.1 unnamed protein product [Didymodactylos carnosus]CAF3932700.1 unnamed protein product [Didymodactylos carnosus]